MSNMRAPQTVSRFAGISLQRSLAIVADAFGRKTGVKIAIGGERAYTDGKLISIPAVDEKNPRVMQLIWGYLAHEAGHVRHTDFDALGRMAAEGNALLRSVWNILEDVRIENAMIGVYPGTRSTMDATTEIVIGEDERSVSETEPPAKLLVYSLLVLARHQYRNQPFLQPKAEEALRVLRQVFPSSFVLRLMGLMCDIRALGSTQDAIDLARRIVALIQDEANPAPEPPAPNESEPEEATDESEPEEATDGEPSDEPSEGEGDGGDSEAEDGPTPGESGRSAADESGDESAQDSDGRQSSDGADGNAEDGSGSGGDDQTDDDGDGDDKGGQTAGGRGTEEPDQGKGSDSGAEGDADGDSDGGGGEDSPGEGAEASGADDDGDDSEATGEGDRADEAEAGGNANGGGDDDQASHPGQGEDGDIEGDTADDDAGGANTGPGAGPDVLRAVLEAKESDLPGDLFAQVAKALEAHVSRNPWGETQNLFPEGRLFDGCAATGARLVDQVTGESRRLVAQLHGIVQSETMTRHRTARRGRRLSAGHLHRAAVGDDRIFARSEERKAPNTAMHLLVDMSGSMEAPKCTLAMEAALALALAMESMRGVSLAATAFPHTEWEVDEANAVTVMLRRGQRVRSRAGAFAQWERGGTPLTEALWFVAAELLAASEPRKAAIVLTDGDPENRASALEMVQRMTAAGIEVIGIGIFHDASWLFPRHVSISALDQLKPELMRIGRQLLIV
jgi:Mg-chelatase subunit ChlD